MVFLGHLMQPARRDSNLPSPKPERQSSFFREGLKTVFAQRNTKMSRSSSFRLDAPAPTIASRPPVWALYGRAEAGG
jgi:hypothetical protein